MSDKDFQDGAPAAAAAGRPVGGLGKCHSTDPLRETYQRAAGPHGGPSCVCLNCGQLRCPPDEDSLALLHHPAPHPPAGLLVEKLGRALRLHTSRAAVSGVTRPKSPFVTLLTRAEVTVATALLGILRSRQLLASLQDQVPKTHPRISDQTLNREKRK